MLPVVKKKKKTEQKSISTVELENFAMELLFSQENLDRCEKTADGTIDNKIEAGIKKQLEFDQGGENGRPAIVKEKTSTALRQNEGRRITSPKDHFPYIQIHSYIK